jgi:hypothetical protein
VDLGTGRGAPVDHEAVRAMTAGLMQSLTDLVLDLRGRYPERWSDDG